MILCVVEYRLFVWPAPLPAPHASSFWASPQQCLPPTASNPSAGLESIYIWGGKVQSDAELLLKIKTRKSLMPALAAHIKSMHPYDTPEVVAVDAVGGYPEYLNWVLESTKGG